MPIMPFIDDALYVGGFAGLVVVARQALGRYDLKLAALPGFGHLRWPFGRGAALRERPSFTAVCTSGNTAFDAWRDGEIRRIEAQRRALETRLQEFEGFVDKLKRAQDRATFDRFMAEHPGAPGTTIDITGAPDHPDHRAG